MEPRRDSLCWKLTSLWEYVSVKSYHSIWSLIFECFYCSRSRSDSFGNDSADGSSFGQRRHQKAQDHVHCRIGTDVVLFQPHSLRIPFQSRWISVQVTDSFQNWPPITSNSLLSRIAVFSSSDSAHFHVWGLAVGVVPVSFVFFGITLERCNTMQHSVPVTVDPFSKIKYLAHKHWKSFARVQNSIVNRINHLFTLGRHRWIESCNNNHFFWPFERDSKHCCDRKGRFQSNLKRIRSR